ncbi:unnamed protein product, partial [Effrenium voratum]
MDVLPKGSFLFASEATTEGHLDRLCDLVCEAVLDACLAQDDESKVQLEACAKSGQSGMVMILGEVVSKASVQYEQVIREAVKAVGYDSEEKGLDWRTINVIVAVEDQGPDITAPLAGQRQLADDQVVVQGYASDETPELMPCSQLLAQELCTKMDTLRREGTLAWLRPDARVQVTVKYNTDAEGGLVPLRVHSVAIVYGHLSEVKPETAEKDLLEKVVHAVVPERLLDSDVQFLFTPRARRGDAGLSGRRFVTESYGGWAAAG